MTVPQNRTSADVILNSGLYGPNSYLQVPYGSASENTASPTKSHKNEVNSIQQEASASKMP